MPPHTKAIEALASLKSELSRCFKSGNQKMPIAVGIHHDVFAHFEKDTRFSRRNLRDAIGLYTSGKVYLGKIVTGTSRINLFGKETTKVTIAEEENAKAKLRKK
jgi:ProP effector